MDTISIHPHFVLVYLCIPQKSISDNLLERTLDLVCHGKVTRTIYDTRELAKTLNIPTSKIKATLSKLKSIGYEVRSTKTNLSMEKNTYLIPYAFPTLTPQSVQLKKKL